jgi:hypothetical protein
MSRRTALRAGDSRTGSWIVATMLAMVIVPAAITLNTVRDPAVLQLVGSNPTPHGYTWSLLLFVMPILAISVWLVPKDDVTIPKRAFWRTILVLAPVGFGLDFFFARRLFTFSNAGATLGIGAPALGNPVPIEEYAFYLSGFMAVLLLYVWMDEFWLAAYNVSDYGSEAKAIPRLLQFHPTSVVVGGLLLASGIAFKKIFSESPDGFPEYFSILILGGFVPAAGFFPTVRRFINWRAFSLTLFFVLLISLVWEATLGVPYGWWGYRPGPMLGLRIGAWSGLPIEAVCVWVAVTYGTVIVFEVVKIWQASERPAKDAFFGGAAK